MLATAEELHNITNLLQSPDQANILLGANLAKSLAPDLCFLFRVGQVEKLDVVHIHAPEVYKYNFKHKIEFEYKYRVTGINKNTPDYKISDILHQQGMMHQYKWDCRTFSPSALPALPDQFGVLCDGQLIDIYPPKIGYKCSIWEHRVTVKFESNIKSIQTF